MSEPAWLHIARSKEEALANIKEAIEGYMSVLQEDGLPVPEDHFDAEVIAV